MKILSLFDGMSCGRLAFMAAEIPVDRYVAYEIDKYAIKTTMHNFPDTEEKGDVFQADFTQYWGFDFLVGGSPCTYWSIAQLKNRETEASGIGWELFSQYVRALKEAEPRFFIYENNKSMSRAIRDSIRQTFGFEEICINSALVSAQNRNRYYWVGKRNPDGTYSKVDVRQPKDRGILLKDILDGEAVGETAEGKSYAIKAQHSCTAANLITNGKFNASGEAEPTAVDLQVEGRKKNKDGSYHRIWESNYSRKSYTLTSVEGQRMVAVPPIPCYATPTEVGEDGTPLKAVSYSDGKIYAVYQVNGGRISIKGKEYPIKLADGYYIIRKLAVRECMRLQTIPEWYDFSCVSATQAYKMLGNGWTVEVIAHLIMACMAGRIAPSKYGQISIFD